MERALDEDTGVISLFFCSTGSESCFWEFHPSSVTLGIFVFYYFTQIYCDPYKKQCLFFMYVCVLYYFVNIVT